MGKPSQSTISSHLEPWTPWEYEGQPGRNASVCSHGWVAAAVPRRMGHSPRKLRRLRWWFHNLWGVCSPGGTFPLQLGSSQLPLQVGCCCHLWKSQKQENHLLSQKTGCTSVIFKCFKFLSQKNRATFSNEMCKPVSSFPKRKELVKVLNSNVTESNGLRLKKAAI